MQEEEARLQQQQAQLWAEEEARWKACRGRRDRGLETKSWGFRLRIFRATQSALGSAIPMTLQTI